MLSKDLLMLEVDFIEWRYRNGELVPVGVMEVTRVDGGREVNQEILGCHRPTFRAARFAGAGRVQGGSRAANQGLPHSFPRGLQRVRGL
jgi:hypothetical protein